MHDYPPEYDYDDRDNSVVEQAFHDYKGPYDLYRTTYDYTDCGPSVGICIEYIEVLPPDGSDDYPHEVTQQKWIYCDDLHKLGTWSDIATQGNLIVGISVSSIVEGSDCEVPAIEIDTDPDALADQATDSEPELHMTLRRLFNHAVEDVNAEASYIFATQKDD